MSTSLDAVRHRALNTTRAAPSDSNSHAMVRSVIDLAYTIHCRTMSRSVCKLPSSRVGNQSGVRASTENWLPSVPSTWNVRPTASSVLTTKLIHPHSPTVAHIPGTVVKLSAVPNRRAHEGSPCSPDPTEGTTDSTTDSPVSTANATANDNENSECALLGCAGPARSIEPDTR